MPSITFTPRSAGLLGLFTLALGCAETGADELDGLDDLDGLEGLDEVETVALADEADNHSTPRAGTDIACNRMQLRSSRSYVDTAVASDHTYFYGVTRCNAQTNRYTVDAYSGRLQLQYKKRVAAPNQLGWAPGDAGWEDLPNATTWTSQSSETRIVGTSLAVAVPAGTTPVAMIVRARPVDAQGNAIGVGWSDWVQVNYGTRFGLLSADAYLRSYYYPFSPNELHFSGENHPAGQNFLATIGWAPPCHFHGVPNKNATLECASEDAVMFFLKDVAAGYHNPGLAWTPAATHPLWDLGRSNLLWWLDGPLPGAGGPAGERWIVSNGFEMYRDDGLVQSTTNWDDAQAHFARPLGPDDRSYAFVNPASNDPELRDYVLAPEYVGHGWGVYFGVEGGREWGVHANVYDGVSVPYPASRDEPILHLKFYEGSTGWLTRETDPPAGWFGHREDWYMDTLGLEKLDSRRAGAPVCLGVGEQRCRRYVVNDPDVRHREVMVNPQVTMIRE